MKILIAGVGNLLLGDDGFGVRLAQRLEKVVRSEDVKVVEVGISGISLVQELMDRYDACIILDAVDHGGKPGTLYLLQPLIDFPHGEDAGKLHSELVDMHYAEPSQALRLVDALGIRPKKVYILGCQPLDADGFAENLSPNVQRAVEEAVGMVQEFIVKLQAEA